MALDEETLRAAAAHRGLKLVKSRKRKPGVGDYGLFGLADAGGKPLFGIEDAGLNATPEQIAAYLKKGEASTWVESARVTPDVARDRTPPTRRKPADDQPTPAVAKARPQERRPGPKIRQATAEPAPRAKDAVSHVSPTLEIRTARAGDAEGLAVLLALTGFSGNAAAVARSIASAVARKEPILVARKGEVIGCLAWHLIPSLQGEPIARVTALIVRESDRRQGTGRALFEAASTEFVKRNVAQVEAISEIAVRNANGFYRAIGLEQTGYRFGRKL